MMILFAAYYTAGIRPLEYMTSRYPTWANRLDYPRHKPKSSPNKLFWRTRDRVEKAMHQIK